MIKRAKLHKGLYNFGFDLKNKECYNSINSTVFSNEDNIKIHT